jgi:outer membrane protein
LRAAAALGAAFHPVPLGLDFSSQPGEHAYMNAYAFKWLIVAGLAAMIAALPGTVSAREQGWKVGFVHIQRILEDSKLGRAAKADLEQARNHAAQRLEKSLKKLRLQEAEVSAMQDGDARARAKKALADAWKEHDTLAGRLQLQMENEDQRLVSMVLEAANKVLARIAKEEGFSVVLKDADAVGYLAPEADLTDRVIQALDLQAGGAP